ncbi:MAG: DNA repair protein RecO [Nitrospirae bacterium]|nr:MAG: DNA repair protein RecO [Nitrospirota bacterium]
MLHRTEGIILNTTPFGEADLIVTCLTKDFGIIRLFAKSPRKVGSRFGSSLEPLTHSRIGFFGKEQSRLPRLTQSDIIHSFQPLREDIRLFLQISELIELTIRTHPELSEGKRLFALLLTVLKEIERDGTPGILPLYYKIHTLRLGGFAPRLQNCTRCGSASQRFLLSEGGIVCSNCEPVGKESILIEPGIMKIYNYLLRSRPAMVRRLKVSEQHLSKLADIINSHINYTVVDRLNTREFSPPAGVGKENK